MTLFPEPAPRHTVVREHRRVVPRSRRSDPATSVAAAQSITPGRFEREILHCFVYGRMALTDDDLCNYWFSDRHAATVKSARSRLSKAGLLVACGEGISNRGRRMQKWRLA